MHIFTIISRLFLEARAIAKLLTEQELLGVLVEKRQALLHA